ncbi:MAG TPA: DUF2950 family protein [Planctomycetota bacterium]|nr:DUF2950 family protein [Planctomycetota bacterium]
MKKLMGLGVAIALIATGAALLLPPLRERLPVSNPRSARGHLQALLRAQNEYRQRSPSDAGGPAYWRADIAHLFRVNGRGQPVGLIEAGLARADDRPQNPLELPAPRSPLDGYWYRSVLHEGETRPDSDHVALCAFPDQYPASGRHTLLMSESGVVWAKDLGRGGGVDVIPRDPAQEGWRILAGP